MIIRDRDMPPTIVRGNILDTFTSPFVKEYNILILDEKKKSFIYQI
jgi:hypothetical protein